MSIFQNTCKPKGLGGRMMLTGMNFGHKQVSEWGLARLQPKPDDRCLDIGCGGGANIRRLLHMVPQGVVKGVDYSPVSVEKSRDMNRKAIEEGRCEVLEGNVMNLLFAKRWFNVVTAFETIYFWPDIRQAFHQVHNVLADDGVFLICNETDGDNPADNKWTEKIDGMVIYKDVEIEAALREAGFTDVRMEKNDRHWIAILARK